MRRRRYFGGFMISIFCVSGCLSKSGENGYREILFFLKKCFGVTIEGFLRKERMMNGEPLRVTVILVGVEK